MQLPLFAPESTWRAPELSSLPSWKGAKRISFDVETRDQHLKTLGIGVRRGGYVTGYSFSIEDGPTAYLPIRHAGGDNLPEDAVLRYLQDNAKDFDGDIVGAHLAYDLDYANSDGIEFPNVRYFRDVQIADPLIYELHMNYSLQHIATRLGLPGKDEDLLKRAARDYGVNAKGGMWQLPARYVGRYAEEDTVQPLLILRRQERKIDDADLWKIWNLESQVLPILVKMRQRGVRVDQDRLEKIETWSLMQEAENLNEIHRLTGHRIQVGDVWKPNALAPALEAIGVKLEETAAGNPSIRKDVLDGIDHPVAKHMARARKVNKLRTTFAASVRKYMIDGRIHCTFQQIAIETDGGDQKGARYGRLSCVDPNLQQQPARDDFAKEWRSIYLPEEGSLWASPDFSQQEPRWTTHFAAVMDLPKARAAAQAYHDDPLLDNHTFMAELTGLPRKYAKNIYLGLCYGEGGAKLCQDLGLPTRWALVAGRGKSYTKEFFNTQEEALAARRKLGDGRCFETAGEEGQVILDTFDDRAPFIRKLAKAAEEKAKKTGVIITIGGRHLHFPERPNGEYDWCHKALNRLIQGSAADQTKLALVQLHQAGHFLQLQVHDEICASVSGKEEGEAMSLIMRTGIPAMVPFRVDVEIGPSWGESMS